MLLKQHRHPMIAVLLDGLGIPEMLKLHWLKPTFARNPPASLLFTRPKVKSAGRQAGGSLGKAILESKLYNLK